MALPPLRNLEVTPVRHEGRTLISLSDPKGYVEGQVVLSPVASFVVSHLDGKADVSDIQYAFLKMSGGTILPSDKIQEVVDNLDKHGLLQSEAFEAIRMRVDGEFEACETRPAWLEGKSYPKQADELRRFLDGLFLDGDGPGVLPGKEGSGAPTKCLVVPHIDLRQGGHSFAHGYLKLFERGRPEVVFIFGVAHAAPPVPFVLTRKNFATPLGVLRTDRDIVAKLAAACSWDPYEHEMTHRTEHSVEFQAVMLSYLYSSDVRVVPVLCSQIALPEECDVPGGVKQVAVFLDACREAAREAGERVSVIAAADLAHVGKRFGDSFNADASVAKNVEARDREDLQYVLAADAEGFYRSVMKDKNARRVCGLDCIYSALKTVAGNLGEGKFLHYGTAKDPLGGMVSFASLIFD